MKRRDFVKFIVAMMVSVLCLGFTSCGGSDEDEPTFSLKGSTYSRYNELFSFIVCNGEHKMYEVLRFTSDTKCELTYRYDSPTGEIFGKPSMCTYVLNYPKIDIKEDGDGSYSVSGTFVDANAFRTSGIGGSIVEYQKQ